MKSIHRFTFSALALLIMGLVPEFVAAQSEAQAVDEIIEFQKIEQPNRKVQLHKGDAVIFPVYEAADSTRLKGKVVAWEDSTLVVQEKWTGREHRVHLGKTKRIKVIRKARLIAGKVLVILAGINFGIVVAFAIAAFIAELGWWYVGELLLIGLAVNPFFWLALGFGILLMVTGKKTIELAKWKWRRLRRVFVRKERP